VLLRGDCHLVARVLGRAAARLARLEDVFAHHGGGAVDLGWG